jgi:hypothetical protein
LKIRFLNREEMEEIGQGFHYIILNAPGLRAFTGPESVKAQEALDKMLSDALVRQLAVLRGAGCKIHLELSGGAEETDRIRPFARSVRGLIGSRNVGNNHGFIAWQKDEIPQLFHIRGDPLNYPSYSCLVRSREGRLSIRALRFENERAFEDRRDVTEEIEWCVFANWVLRDGQVVPIEEIIDQFYDIRHVLAFDREHLSGQQIEAEIYGDYPQRFRENVLRAWREKGVPRNRFLHNGLGFSEDHLFILQREGTIEEVAHGLREAGAQDGMILDNGGSVFCWAWWPYPKGGFLFTAPDFRPPSSAIIAFVLKGPAATDLPSGSVSFSVV